MKILGMSKSTPAEIRERFDNDVERFSNLETGQKATIDASLQMDLITSSASYVNKNARKILDIGCGAGNYTIKTLEKLPNLDCTLVDLSLPMLNRAVERITPLTNGQITTLQGDIREIDIGTDQFDIVISAAVLHHLRETSEWKSVFSKIYESLKPGGSFWIFDLLSQEDERIEKMNVTRYGNYLKKEGGQSYMENVFDYIEKEDSPRTMNFQLDLMREVGFKKIEILHKNSVFGSFGAIK